MENAVRGCAVWLWALFASNSAQAAWVKIEPADAGFSVFLPATPTMTTEQKSGTVSRIWVARAGNISCVMVVTDYSERLVPDTELERDMNNFLKGIEGTATAKQKRTFAKHRMDHCRPFDSVSAGPARPVSR